MVKGLSKSFTESILVFSFSFSCFKRAQLFIWALLWVVSLAAFAHLPQGQSAPFEICFPPWDTLSLWWQSRGHLSVPAQLSFEGSWSVCYFTLKLLSLNCISPNPLKIQTYLSLKSRHTNIKMANRILFLILFYCTKYNEDEDEITEKKRFRKVCGKKKREKGGWVSSVTATFALPFRAEHFLFLCVLLVWGNNTWFMLKANKENNFGLKYTIYKNTMMLKGYRVLSHVMPQRQYMWL